ncbi:HlyD family secretion protein [Luteolibacter pohnpeiensis]|uniref:HlyD family secretion protein n=1 Tax=Luteolibacter pohnpeiensis TaxID=454153 RepID=A0A934VR49_9BACT|nr:HlyD family secretion protein [Luteolibacter pohnpeiensis]MBK1882801.1 HlyD family secretion protein [Luteolibacter pohnpeiensis]
MKSLFRSRILLALVRCFLTLAFIFLGVQAARRCWLHYRTEPWTRDGRVNAELVKIVPEVSGKIAQLPVVDNQLVQKGDVLFTIDPENFQLALEQAEAQLKTRQSELDLAKQKADRRGLLVSANAISAEEQQSADTAVAVAQAALANAVATRDLANLNLRRTTVVSPVNGYITNLHLRLGDYASAGSPQFSIIDRESYWVAGYFEETKLPSVHPGDLADITFMAGTAPLRGHVEAISRGIADSTSSGTGLADVDPIFNWVRLAQRIPVRIKIDTPIDDRFLAAGMTCSISVHPKSHTPEAAEPDHNPFAFAFKSWSKEVPVNMTHRNRDSS